MTIKSANRIRTNRKHPRFKMRVDGGSVRKVQLDLLERQQARQRRVLERGR